MLRMLKKVVLVWIRVYPNQLNPVGARAKEGNKIPNAHNLSPCLHTNDPIFMRA
jgi:ribosomal protein L16/L10AE